MLAGGYATYLSLRIAPPYPPKMGRKISGERRATASTSSTMDAVATGRSLRQFLAFLAV